MFSFKPPKTPALDYGQLESRVLFSATPMVDAIVNPEETIAPVASTQQVAQVEQPAPEDCVDCDNTGQFRFSDVPEDSESGLNDEQAAALEIVFVDTDVEDYQQLVDDLLSNDDEREFEVYLLDNEQDGVEQISQILAGYSDVDAIHLISHGSAGQVNLGNTWLSFDNLDGYARQIAGWNNALAEGADLLIYGCDLAASDQGLALAEALGALCDCDVAASDDDTGQILLGGDWELEHATGAIETGIAFSASLQTDWIGLLAGNTPPTLSMAGGQVTYNAGDPLTIIDGAANVTDADSADFDTGTLTVDFTANSTANDRLEIDTSGDFDLQGNNVRYQPGGPPTTIGTWTGGTDGSTPLVITFNNNATPNIVQALVQNIGYRNVAGVPTPDVRTVRFVVTDGDGGTSNTETETIKIEGVNVAPTNTVPGMQTTTQDTSLVFSAGGGNQISTSDPDAGAALIEASLNVTNGTVTLNAGGGLANSIAGEDIVPERTNGTQSQPAVSRAADGRYVVVWSGSVGGDADGIAFQLYDADHNKVGGAVRVNSTKTNVQEEPRVAMDDNGNFVVVWTSSFQDGDGDGIFARRFDSNGTALTGEIQVNSYTTNGQDQADIAIDSDGDFVIVWQSNGQDGSNEGVFAQRFNANGTKAGTEFQVNTVTTNKQHRAKVAMDADGNFVVVWEDAKLDAGQPGIFARRYDNNGNALEAAEFLVNSSSDKKQEFPDVAMDAAGNFVVIWVSQNQDEPSSRGVFGQLFNTSGNKIGPAEFQVNTTTVNHQREPEVSMDADGDFVVVWESVNQDNPGDFLTGVYVQQFDKTGATIGTERLVNQTVAASQSAPDVATDADGDFVVVWAGNGVGDSDGVFAQQYDNASELTFTAGDGAADSLVTFTGTVDEINDALNGLIFTPNSGFVGLATIDVTINDLGNTGVGGPLQDMDTVTIDVTAGADTSPPTVVNNTGSTVTEGGSDAITNSELRYADAVPASSIFYNVTAGPMNGQLELTTDPGMSITSFTQDDIDTGKLVYIHAGGEAAADSFTFNVDDGLGNVVVGEMFALTISPVNDPSTLSSVEGGSLAYTEGDGEVAITSTINVADVDDNNIESATIQITGNYVNGEDVLNFIDTVNIAAIWNAATGTLTLTGTDSKTNYRAALRSVTYENTSDNPNTATRTISFTINDGDDPSNTATRDVAVSDVNDDPYNAGGVPSDQVVTEDISTDIDLSSLNLADIDAGNGSLTVTLSTASGGTLTAMSGGGVTVAGSGTGVMTLTGTVGNLNAYIDNATNIEYLGAMDATGNDADTITVKVNDNGNTGSGGGGDVVLAAVNVDISAINDDPTITSSATPTADENQSTALTVTTTDVDGGARTYTLSGGVDQALFSINPTSGLLTFNTAPDFENPADADTNNVYEVEVTANDGNGGSDVQLINVTVADVVEGTQLIVDTTDDYGTADARYGDTTSIAALLVDKGSDNLITLREAIDAANRTANGGSPDEIRFNIADNDARHFYYRDDGIADSLSLVATTTLADGAIGDFDPDYPFSAHSWFSINVDSTLPQLTVIDAVIINGYTQSGASANTLADGDDALLRIELTSDGGGVIRGLEVEDGGDGSSILGLAINNFANAGILTEPGADGVTIQGNFLGTDITGTLDVGNGDSGVQLRSSGNQVGGQNAADRNVISGNDDRGIVTFTFGPLATGNVIENNFVGIDAIGSNALANNTAGIQVWNQSGIQIRDNVISGNSGDGIWLRSGSTNVNTTIQGNLIGVGADGTTPIGNTSAGIQIEAGSTNTTIGGTMAGEANTIANSGTDGVSIVGGSGATIRGNVFTGNAGLGIDLIGVNGVDSNDAADIDNGPNGLQNYPVLTNATVNGADLTVTGTLNSTPNTMGIVIDFYWSPAADSSGHGEAANYIGSTTVNTDGSGDATFNVPFIGAAVPAGTHITATSTDTNGNTSEFSLNISATTSNSPPTISGISGDSLTYSEGDGAVVIEQGADAIVADADSADFNTGNLSISIVAGNDSAEDVLSIRNNGVMAGEIGFDGMNVTHGGTLIGTTAGGSGGMDLVITFNANATPAAVTALVQAITYENTDVNSPTTGTRSIRFTVNDGDGGSSLNQLASVNVSPVNDPSQLSAIEGAALPYSEGAGPQAITSTIAVADVDDVNIESATIQITGNYVMGEDQLAFADTAQIFGFWNATTGTLTLSGSDTLSNYQAALRSVTYENTENDPSGATRTITFAVNDGSDASNSVTRDIDVMPVNNPPTAMNLAVDNLPYAEGSGPLVVEQGNDAVISDPDSISFDGGNLTVSFTAGSDPSEDMLSIRNQGLGAGQIGFDGTNVFYGGTQFGVVTGGSAGIDLVVLFDANADPTAVTALVRNITFEDVDVTAATLGIRTVRFTINDGDGGISANYDLTVDVNNGNNAPVIANFAGDALDYFEDDGPRLIEQGSNIVVVDSDSLDFESGKLTVSISVGNEPTRDVLSVRHEGMAIGQIGFDGTLVSFGGTAIGSIAGGDNGSDLVVFLNLNATPAAVEALIENITYANIDTANPPVGTRTISITLDDGDGGASFAYNSTVSITPVNDAPVAIGDSFQVDNDSTLRVSAGGVISNDIDLESDPLTSILVSGPTNGTLLFSADGSFTYTPNDGFFEGIDSFSYYVSDGALDSNVITVTITVNRAVGPPPIFVSPEIAPAPAIETTSPQNSDIEVPQHVSGEAAGPPNTTPPPVNNRISHLASVQLISVLTADSTGLQVTQDDVFAEALTIQDEFAHVAREKRLSELIGGFGQIVAPFNVALLGGDLVDLQKQLNESADSSFYTTGAAFGGTTVLTAGYVLWMIRSGWLATSVLAQMPAWNLVDPLVVLDSLDEATGQNSDEDDSLESMLEQSNSSRTASTMDKESL